MEKIIQVGTKVTLEKNSRWAVVDENGESSDWNPVGITGKVISVNTAIRMPFYVKWENGETNYYREVDLKVLGQSIANKYLIKKNAHGADDFYGNLGESTPLVGTDGEPLFVGDTVAISFKGDDPSIHPVVKSKGRYFVMGYKSATADGNTWDDVSYAKHDSYYNDPHYGNKFEARATLDGVNMDSM